MDRSKTPEQRADALLHYSGKKQMYRWLNEFGANYPTEQKHGASGADYGSLQLPCTPTVGLTDGPDGIRQPNSTAYPAQIALGATWDQKLAYEKGALLGQEGYAKGYQGVLAPGVSSGRSVLAGRTPEYFGEDSVLSGTMAAQQINGLQSNPGVFATLKHYVANEQETNRTTESSNVDERTLREVYERPFEIALSLSDPGAVMCSYNQINSVYACEDQDTLGALKNNMGFKGFVLSDSGAKMTTVGAVKAGLGQEINRPSHTSPAQLDQAVAAGSLTLQDIYESAYSVVRSYIAHGVFDAPISATKATNPSASKAVNTRTPETIAAAREIAEKGAVLLKNDSNALPLNTSKQTVAVIGSQASADTTVTPNAVTVCSQSFFGPALECGGVVAPADSIRDKVSAAGGTFIYDNGKDLNSAKAAAASADTTIVFASKVTGEFADATSMSLDNGGDTLIQSVAGAKKAGSKVIVVLETGSAVTMPWLNDVSSVVEAWYPGEQQGPALVNLLWGDVNFTGKLPMTFPKSLAETPTGNDIKQFPGVVDNKGIRQVDYTEGLEVGYKWYDAHNVAPLFPFGHGLSYSNFEYSKLHVNSANSAKGGKIHVTFDLKNTGQATGSEIAQIYLTLPSTAGTPGKSLAAYQRTSELAPGASQTIDLWIDGSSAAHPLSTWDTAANQWVQKSGTFTVSVGASDRDIRGSDTVEIQAKH
ncbi:beta-glucosidase [Pseudarthrobacter sp. alpha12b]